MYMYLKYLNFSEGDLHSCVLIILQLTFWVDTIIIVSDSVGCA